MIPRGVPYEEAMRQFRWPKPERFNIGRAVCERHPGHALAMIVENADGSGRHWTSAPSRNAVVISKSVDAGRRGVSCSSWTGSRSKRGRSGHSSRSRSSWIGDSTG